MKSKLFFLLLSVSFHFLNAQTNTHTLKLNLLAPVLKTVSLQYEYSITNRKSFLLQSGYSLASNLFEKYYDSYKSFGTRKLIFKDFRFQGGYQISPEYRYYLKEKESAGFFINPYLRYSRYSFQSHVNYVGDNFNVVFTFKGVFSTAGAGLNFGYKWLLGDKMVLETWLLCLHAGTNSFKISAEDEFEFIDKPVFLQDLEKTFEDFPFVKNWVSNITDRKIKAGFTYTFIGTRAGLCLGYKF